MNHSTIEQNLPFGYQTSPLTERLLYMPLAPNGVASKKMENYYFQNDYVDAMKAYKELLPFNFKKPEKEVSRSESKAKVDKGGFFFLND
jgi:hypothetical protein